MILNITEAASHQIKEMMKEEGDVRLRFGVKGGGCSGLSYAMGFEDEINEELDLLEESGGIPIVINRQDAAIVEGTTIDFKQNMMGGGFTIDNPNAIVSCGCGSSFKTATNAGTPDPNC
ncbi:iron-sulfur cluster assembly protein [Halobacillus karajensis]|uniref:Iron-sulfur cluster insertion protein ErpA n=1 Tax=Halobacillus karajensis TaxID=195088 RepID=A0A024PA64_9BACI|nr:iron-sulfur cluster assembly accessory protein [Halobacillus karajensis]CDQ21299.1 Iron-sulfur cluster insertion protein ErpA [Halobacillus karajensis]CDQ25631.1 Iron-sulfur cluster insertion protein ErpA [Halobacillus karajensis]CDQ25902.1 Iron-sulfur cluster insertion protein ErpA [Halobacillus karajensis]SEI10484.1 iron-sulfur cluster assembly protein [Halobacillus karajensis]